MNLPAAGGRDIKTVKNLVYIWGARSFPPTPSSTYLLHRKRMRYLKDRNKPIVDGPD